MVAGHEIVGTVESVGPEVKGFKTGDLVVPTVRRSCPENCLNCRSGESDMCLTGHYFEHGINKLHGFASELAVSDVNYLVKVPEELLDVIVLLEPTSIVEKAVFQVFAVQRRMNWKPKTALMLGAGPIGQLGTALLRLRGLEVCTVARRPRTDNKAKLAESTGAQYVNVKETSLSSLGKTFDIIIEGTGNAAVAVDAANHLSTNGVLCYLGVYGPAEVTFQAGDVLRQMVLTNKLAFGCVNANKRYFEMGVTDFLEIRKRFGNFLPSLITSKIKPEEYLMAYEPSPEEIKTIIEFD